MFVVRLSGRVLEASWSLDSESRLKVELQTLVVEKWPKSTV